MMLPDWLVKLIGIDTGSGQAISWRLYHSWQWPGWATLLFFLALGCYVLAIYKREAIADDSLLGRVLPWMRLAAFAILLLMLAQFTIALERTGLPNLAIIFDDSLSMTIADTYPNGQLTAIKNVVGPFDDKNPSRWKLVQQFLQEQEDGLLRRLSHRYRITAYYSTGFAKLQTQSAEQLAEQAAQHRPQGKTSPLGKSILMALADLRGDEPAAIVFVTDGVNTSGPTLPQAAADARRLGVPLFFLGVGRAEPVPDVWLSDLVADEVAFIGETVNIRAMLSGRKLSGKKVKVVLRDTSSGRILASTVVTVPAENERCPLQLAYEVTQSGTLHYSVEAEPLPEEQDVTNNRLEGTLTVTDRKIRVLMVFGIPCYEYRFLRNFLRRDKTVEVNTLLLEADPQHAEQDPAALRSFPLSVEQLLQYDIIILGDVDPELLGRVAIRNIVQFVNPPSEAGRRGRALICVAGPRFMPAAYAETELAPLLPIDPQTVQIPNSEELHTGYRITPTQLGLQTPPLQLGKSPQETQDIWNQLPALYWYASDTQLRPAARVLAVHSHKRGPDGNPLPLIVVQYVGSGRVLYHATDETWRWRWRRGDLYFGRYWIQTLRWLVRSKLEEETALQLSVDKSVYELGEPIQVQLTVPPQRASDFDKTTPVVVVEQQTREVRRLALEETERQPGIFTGQLNQLPAGKYRLRLLFPQTDHPPAAVDFQVEAPAGEFRSLQADVDAMKQAAELTGGRYLPLAEAESLANYLPPGRRVPIETLPPVPLWNRWPVILLAVLLLCSEWVLRKLAGLV